MPAQFKTLRSTVAGNRPQPATRQVGEVYINYPDMQFGVIDINQNPLDLFAVRFFSGATSYNGGDFVVSGGQLYRANGAIPPGAFNPANWSKIGTAQDLAGYLPLTGGVLSGPLTLAADPTTNLGAATKQYTDNGLFAKVSLSGSTMTGPLLLAADPSVNLGAATKQYVDAGVASANTNANAKVPLAGGVMTGALTLSGDPTVPLGASTKQYSDTKLPLVGGTLTGPLTLSGPPTLPLHAATKAYVDSGAFLPITGGTLTGNLGVSPAAAAAITIVAGSANTYASLQLAKNGTGQAQISGYTGSSTAAANLRWNMALGDPTAESGSNAGSNFAISRYTDAGAFIDSPLTITRSGGVVTLSSSLTLSAGGLTLNSGNIALSGGASQISVPYWATGGHRFNLGWSAATQGMVQVGIDAGAATYNIVKSNSAGAPYTGIIDTMAGGSNGTAAAWQGGTSWVWTTTSSDPRLKSNVEVASKDALAAVNALEVYEFDLTPPSVKAEPQHWNWGLMANDALEAAIPSAFVAGSETAAGTLYASVRELTLIAALVRAVQQLTAKVEALETRLAA